MSRFDEALKFYKSKTGDLLDIPYVYRFSEEFSECFYRNEELTTFDDWTKLETLLNQKITYDEFDYIRDNTFMDFYDLTEQSPELDDIEYLLNSLRDGQKREFDLEHLL